MSCVHIIIHLHFWHKWVFHSLSVELSCCFFQAVYWGQMTLSWFKTMLQLPWPCLWGRLRHEIRMFFVIFLWVIEKSSVVCFTLFATHFCNSLLRIKLPYRLAKFNQFFLKPIYIYIYTGASQYIRMSWKSSFISVIQLKLWNLCIK